MSELTIRGGLRHAAANPHVHELGFRAIIVVHPIDCQPPDAFALGQSLAVTP